MTRVSFVFAAVFAAAAVARAVHAEDVSVGTLKISAPWARATPKSATVGAGYLRITNAGNTSDRLVAGSADVSNRFEIHEMSMDNGVMKMRPIAGGLEVKPGQTVELKPGGYHVMFVGLKHPLAEGDSIKVTLDFEKAGKVNVTFPVAGIGAQSPMGHSMPGMNMGH